MTDGKNAGGSSIVVDITPTVTAIARMFVDVITEVGTRIQNDKKLTQHERAMQLDLLNEISGSVARRVREESAQRRR